MPDRKLDDAWAERIRELRRRREFAAGMGGPDNLARQHDAGRLTVRERIAAIAAADSLREVGTLAESRLQIGLGPRARAGAAP